MNKWKKVPFKVMTTAMLSLMMLSSVVSAEAQDESSNETVSLKDIHQSLFADQQQESEDVSNDPMDYQNVRKNNSQLFSPDQDVRVIVELNTPVDDTSTSFEKVQDQVIDKLPKGQSKEVRHRFHEGFNGFSMEAKFKDLKDIQKIDGVKRIHIARTYTATGDESKSLVQAQRVWQSMGYEGEGMLVAVVDSGVDYKHTDMTLTDKGMAQEKLTSSAIGAKLASTEANDIWYSDKVPTGYDWADNDNDVFPATNPHGMHVSGIISANGNEALNGVKGIAPGAQILAEKVFSDKGGGAKEDDIIAGIQHAVEMGADVINMSLGSDAGPVSETEDPVQKAIRQATEQGVLVVVAGGNASYSTKNNIMMSSLLPYADNPDVGTVGSPGVSPFALSVASYENNNMHMNSLHSSDGTELTYQDQTYSGFVLGDKLDPNKEYEVVYGVEGKDTDIKNMNLTGKIMICQPKTTYANWSYVQNSAKAKGAVATIFVPPTVMKDYPQIQLYSGSIPVISTSKDAGQNMIAKLQVGQKLTVKLSNGTWIDNPLKNTVSYFSSWGTPENLDFKPEITGVGGQIYSTIPNNKYQVMSGTSMATPQVAGGAALLMESMRNKGLAKNEETALLAKLALMNTANIIADPRTDNKLPYSPRMQGSGLMEIKNAINTPVLLRNKRAPLEQAGSVALHEIGDTHFNMKLEMQALEGKDVPDSMEYKVVVDVLTDERTHASYDLGAFGFAPRENDYNTTKMTRIEGADVHVNGGDAITIKRGKQKELSIDVQLPETMKKNTFVEGFVRLVPTSGNKSDKVVPLSMPYMGFYGKWDEPKNIDPSPEKNDAFLGYTTLWDDISDSPLALDPVTHKYTAGRVGVSPYSINEGVIPSFTVLRNLSSLEAYIVDKDGNQVKYLGDFNEFGGAINRKNIMSSSGSYYSFDVPAYYWKAEDENGNDVPDGDYKYVLRSTLDFAGARPQTTEIPVKVDSQAPHASNINVTPTADGKFQISFDVKDNEGGVGFAQAVVYLDGSGAGSVLKPGSTSMIVRKAPKSIVVMAEDAAYNEGYTVWGDSSNINPGTLIQYLTVQNYTKVNENSPAKVIAFSDNKLQWKFYIKDANGNVVFTKEYPREDEVRFTWAPGSEIPNGTYTLYADGQNKEGFKVTKVATQKIIVSH
ncbi:S8 family serine peptidase [Gottfriedia sp. NPDC057948]|uniref:S8 family serine peptidase n=1 Tax=Gottfriedia sp. NPDC057948 TaxID=3346287 RepID=UPI0036DC1C54